MFTNADKTSKPKQPSTATPSTPSTQQKRGLTSPDCPLDLKKNKVYLSPRSDAVELFESEMLEEDATPMEGATGGEPKVSITLRECDIKQISDVLKNTFKDDLREELTKTVKDIVAGVLSGLSEQIKSLTEENENIRKENTDMKARVDRLETATEVAEQYSRRNCIRISGIPEDDSEDTDDTVFGLPFLSNFFLAFFFCLLESVSDGDDPVINLFAILMYFVMKVVAMTACVRFLLFIHAVT